MRLYCFESLNGRKACAVAKHLGVAAEHVRIDLGKGEHKAPGLNELPAWRAPFPKPAAAAT
jgi:glutathione S-transferase